MAIDTSLIKGAEFAATGGSPTGGYIDPAKYLSPGIKKFTDQIEAGIKKSEDAFASLMDDFDSYVDLSRLSDNQLSTAKNWLVDKKRKYSDIASRLSKMQRTDPKYSELTDELNRIQGAINTFAQQKKAYITNRIQMKDSDFDEYSRVDPKQVENFTNMYKNGAGFTVDETGNMIFKGIDGEDMPFYLSEEPDKKAQDQASAIINLKKDVITKAFSGEKIDQDLLNLKLDAIIKNSQQARSLLQDGVLSDAVINIPEDFNLEKDDKAVVDQTKNLLAKSLMDVYNTKYKPKPVELSATQEKNAIENKDIKDFVDLRWGKDVIESRGKTFNKIDGVFPGEKIKYKEIIPLEKMGPNDNPTEVDQMTFDNKEELMLYIKLK